MKFPFMPPSHSPRWLAWIWHWALSSAGTHFHRIMILTLHSSLYLRVILQRHFGILELLPRWLMGLWLSICLPIIVYKAPLWGFPFHGYPPCVLQPGYWGAETLPSTEVLSSTIPNINVNSAYPLWKTMLLRIEIPHTLNLSNHSMSPFADSAPKAPQYTCLISPQVTEYD